MSLLTLIKSFFKSSDVDSDQNYARIPDSTYFDDVKNEDVLASNISEIVIPLHQAYRICTKKYQHDRNALDNLVKNNKNLTFVIDCGTDTTIKNDCFSFDFYDEKSALIENIRVIGPNVQVIGDNFLSCLKNLVNLDLRSLTNVYLLGSGFLFGNRSLKHIDLSAFSKVNSVGHNFLSSCDSLMDIDLKPFERLSVIPLAFLAGCESLEYVDLSSFKRLKNIEESFLCECKSLRRVYIPSVVEMEEKLPTHVIVERV